MVRVLGAELQDISLVQNRVHATKLEISAVFVAEIWYFNLKSWGVQILGGSKFYTTHTRTCTWTDNEGSPTHPLTHRTLRLTSEPPAREDCRTVRHV